MAELVDQRLQRHAVLQRVADGLGEGVGETRNGRAFLRHHQKDFSRHAVFEQADRDVALVAGNVELVRQCVALVWQLAASRRLLRERGRDRRLHGVGGLLADHDTLGIDRRLRGVERLRALGAVAVNRDGLGTETPRLEIRLLDVLDRGIFRHVHGLADRARDERLGGAHHLDVTHVVDRALALRGLEGAVEHRQVTLHQVGRAFNGFLLVDVRDDVGNLRGRVAKLLQRGRHGLVDDLHHAAADQLLVLHERDVGFDAGRVAVHHEADGAGRRQHGGLRVAVTEVFAELDRLIPRLLGAGIEVIGHVLLVDVLDRVAMLAHDAQERLAIDVVALERTAVVARDARRLSIRLAGHHRGERTGVIAAGIAVVGQAARHQQRAEVGVAQAQRAEGVAVLGNRRGRVARVVDQDLLRRDHRAARRAVCLDVELAVFLDEGHQVQRRQVAGRVVQEHVLRARVARVDPRRIRAGVPFVDGGVELHAGVAAHPGAFGDQAHEVARLVGVHHFAARDRLGLPQAIIQHRAHELVGHANGVVRVLEEHRPVGGAGERAVVAGIDQRPRLLFFLNLAADEVDDVGVLGVEDDHLRRAARLAARLDHARERVEALHERHRPRSRAAASQQFLRRTNRREIAACARAELEQHALGLGQAKNRVHGVVNRVNEARGTLRRLLEPAVEPHGAVEGRLLVDQQELQVVAERLERRIRREVLLLTRPAGNGLDHAANQLLDRLFTLWRADVTPEIF